MRRSAPLALLGLALLLGALLRLYRLSAADLSADEAAAWAAAAAPDARAVAARQPALDAGKLPLYDLALHQWIGMFGDSVAAMRALSAVLGIVAIALAFAATREVMIVMGGTREIEHAALAGALSALLVAANLVLVTQARTARMYPLVLVMELAQVSCFVHAQGSRPRLAGRSASLLGVAVFSALAVAANFTAALLIAGEAVWLGWAALRRIAGSHRRGAPALHLLWPALALAAGVALLAPFAMSAGHVALGALRSGVLSWARLRPPWWPLRLLRRASGKAPFLLFAPLGLYAGWRVVRDEGGAALAFLLCWLVVPPMLVMIVSYAITPIEQTRYVIASVVAFLVLAAIGLALIDDVRLRAVLLVLALALSLDHVRRDFRKPQFAQWRAATAAALTHAGPDGRIAVAPAYAVNVVRYYLAPAQRARAEPADPVCGMRQRVLILGGMDLLAPARLDELTRCFGLVRQRLRFVEVRER